MSSRRKAIAAMTLAVVVCAVVAVLVFLVYTPSSRTTSKNSAADPSPQRGTTHHPGSVDTADVVREEGVAAPAGYAEAHAAIAEAMGYISMVCWVGPDWDGEVLVGGYYNMKIENGWYSHVETSLHGRRAVELRKKVPCPDTGIRLIPCDIDFETAFWVSWEADEPGQAVTCTVEYPTYGELRVAVRDQYGEPVDGVLVTGCGGEGRTANGERAVLTNVYGGEGCRLFTFCSEREPCYSTHVVLSRPIRENEIREVTIDVIAREGVDSLMLHIERSRALRDAEAAEEFPPSLRRSSEDELVVLRQMASTDGKSEAASVLVEDLIRHIEWYLEEQSKSDDRVDELHQLFEDQRNASAHEERKEIAETIQEITDEMIEDL